MPCCKCEEYLWHDRPLDLAYKDEATDKGYCLFHAPAEHKGMSVEDFNAEVRTRINKFKANNAGTGKICDLAGTIFPGDMSFRAYDNKHPLPDISFDKVTFTGQAIFELTMFSGVVHFWKATFRDDANFAGAWFNHDVGFDRTTFSRDANFWRTYFHFEVRFPGTTFNGQTDFDFTTFGGVAYFEGVKAEKNALRLHSLKNPSLANLNFTSMDTECFSFKGCDWPDRLWPEAQEKPDYKACEELYRSLKQKAASEHDQPLVSKWHYREKLMALEQIKAKRGWKARLGLTGLYYWCSGFGEDPAQAFRVLAGLLGCALLALSGFKLWETGFGNYQPDLGKILEIPAELLALVPFVKTEAKALASTSGVLAPAKAIVTSLLHILLAAQIALFAFALRNRFRR